ncbi:papain-like cysteine peptidase superfamily protein [Fadolivirus algeromassiliense]|jgi:hypothetical protein|uniref:Papain-like cysteine peptidase superfamily protein n=1 Tax=Fadolivirus FV1/VV64 TaxID=3070911 RepID=A0A7D3R218_9VIRU|nr:papain-like cysteine peptidase superfamily protein [Fadolivirus algeromassiliense]QKF94761.1 papain-like cysteine peptidase superfamily protein [Fadolivirus FV1/VV64]
MQTLLDNINTIILRHKLINNLKIQINEQLYLQPFNFKLKDNSSFIDPTLQFIFPIFVKLGLIGKTGRYTEIISRMLTEPNIDAKNNIKFDFHRNYVPEYKTDWAYGQGGNMQTLFQFIIDKLREENGYWDNEYIENSIITYAKTYSGNSTDCYDFEYTQGYMIAPNDNIYLKSFETLFICKPPGKPKEIYKQKIILPKYLLLIMQNTQIDTRIPKNLDFGKVQYTLIGVACHCNSYKKINNKWYYIHDCNPAEIIDESNHIFFVNEIFNTYVKGKDYPELVAYEADTSNTDKLTFDVNKTDTYTSPDYLLIENLWNGMNVYK